MTIMQGTTILHQHLKDELVEFLCEGDNELAFYFVVGDESRQYGFDHENPLTLEQAMADCSIDESIVFGDERDIPQLNAGWQRDVSYWSDPMITKMEVEQIEVGTTVKILPHKRYRSIYQNAMLETPQEYTLNGGQYGVVISVSHDLGYPSYTVAPLTGYEYFSGIDSQFIRQKGYLIGVDYSTDEIQVVSLAGYEHPTRKVGDKCQYSGEFWRGFFETDDKLAYIKSKELS